MAQQQKQVNGTPAMAATASRVPAGYKGLYGFHKYWGKKPHEPLAYLVEQLTKPGQVVLDPFVGSGITAREALLRGRRFVGFDINPVATSLARLLIRPPRPEALHAGMQLVESSVKKKIMESYLLKSGKEATHFLWNEKDIAQVWSRAARGRVREEHRPTAHDRMLYESFAGYRSQWIRPPRFFTNGRINTAPGMSLGDIMTGRAQRNIDLLIEAIGDAPGEAREALRLCLTAASGQMTKMVFAITGRGKGAGKKASRIEIGSWVIGYWRPKLHFEVNVWNCFERRVSRLLRALAHGDPLSSTAMGCAAEVVESSAQACIACGDCRQEMQSLRDHSVDLIITDPPHSDRIPYLELSEFWNCILDANVNFDREIVFSNAKERAKSAEDYTDSMREFFLHASRVLAPAGFMVVLFNARKAEQWAALREISAGGEGGVNPSLHYVGQFPCTYSARSVVQDSRKGSLKSDYALVFTKQKSKRAAINTPGGLGAIPGWSCRLPEPINGGCGEWRKPPPAC